MFPFGCCFCQFRIAIFLAVGAVEEVHVPVRLGLPEVHARRFSLNGTRKVLGTVRVTKMEKEMESTIYGVNVWYHLQLTRANSTVGSRFSWFAACGLGSHLRRFVPQNFLVRNVENERWVGWSRSLLSAVLELLSVAKGIGWKIWSESQKTLQLCQGCLFCAFLRACDLLSPFLSWWSGSLCQTPEGTDLLSAYS